MFFGAHSIIFETLFVFARKITFRFSPRALFDLPDLQTDSKHQHLNIFNKAQVATCPSTSASLRRCLRALSFLFTLTVNLVNHPSYNLHHPLNSSRERLPFRPTTVSFPPSPTLLCAPAPHRCLKKSQPTSEKTVEKLQTNNSKY